MNCPKCNVEMEPISEKCWRCNECEIGLSEHNDGSWTMSMPYAGSYSEQLREKISERLRQIAKNAFKETVIFT